MFKHHHRTVLDLLVKPASSSIIMALVEHSESESNSGDSDVAIMSSPLHCPRILLIETHSQLKTTIAPCDTGQLLYEDCQVQLFL